MSAVAEYVNSPVSRSRNDVLALLAGRRAMMYEWDVVR